MTTLLLATLLGCLPTAAGPCDDYCNYMCSCHAGDDGFDCDQCRTEYAAADPALQDQCEISLRDQIDADEAAAVDCDGIGSPTDTAAGR